MKRKFTALILAAAACLACSPFTAGCSAKTDYVLRTDESGNKYYVASCSGVSSGLKGEVVINSYYGEGDSFAPVTEIADEGFTSTGATKITIPATVTKIGAAAFAYNNYLETVVFEEGSRIEEISRGTFGSCPSLKEITLPDTVKSVGVLSFYNCSALESIQMSAAELIGERAFEYCYALKEIILPETLAEIGTRAFMNSGLTEIVIPDSVTDIGYAAFHSCTSLEKATVGSGIKVIKSGAFGYCTSLKEVHLPATLEKVEGVRYTGESFYCGHAFHNDTALTDVYFGGSSEEWAQLKKSIDNTTVNEGGSTFDNGALLSATIHCAD